MAENEQSKDVLVAKLDMILDTVNDIKSELNCHTDKISIMHTEIELLKQRDENQQKTIDKLVTGIISLGTVVCLAVLTTVIFKCTGIQLQI